MSKNDTEMINNATNIVHTKRKSAKFPTLFRDFTNVSDTGRGVPSNKKTLQ